MMKVFRSIKLINLAVNYQYKNNIKFYVGQSAIENWDLLDKAKSIDQTFIDR